jgi:hypothetical protein
MIRKCESCENDTGHLNVPLCKDCFWKRMKKHYKNTPGVEFITEISVENEKLVEKESVKGLRIKSSDDDL